MEFHVGTKRSREESTQDDSLSSAEATYKRARVASKTEEPSCPAYQDVFEYPEVFLHILSFLPVEDLVTFERVSKYWRRICTDQWLWKRIYLGELGGLPVTDKSLVLTAILKPTLTDRQAESSSFTDEATSVTPTVKQHQEETSSLESALNVPRDIDIPVAALSEDLDSQEFSRPRVDWKLLTKIDTNWATGTAGQYSLSPSPSPAPSTSRRAHLQDTPTNRSQQQGSTVIPSARTGSSRSASESQRQRHLLALSSPFIFVAYPSSPLLHVHASNESSLDTASSKRGSVPNQPLALIPPPPGWSSLNRPDLITCIKVDSNDSAVSDCSTNQGEPVRIAVFYQSGGFVILSVKPQSVPPNVPATQVLPRVTWTRVLIHKPSTITRGNRRSTFQARAQGDPVIVSEFHSPILISCSQKFYISVWQLPEPVASVPGKEETEQRQQDATLLKTLYSPVSFHPATLSLRATIAQNSEQQENDQNDEWESSQMPHNQLRHFRASLAYAVPLYPERWTLAVQDFDIGLPGPRTPAVSLPTAGRVEVGDCFHVGRSSSFGSYRLPLRWPLRPTGEIVGVKGDCAIGIGLDDNFAVLAGSDNQIQVYKVPERSGSISRPLSSTAENSTVVGQSHNASAIRRELTHVQTLLAHSSAITAIALKDGRCVSAGNDEKILVWNVDRQADIVPADGGADLELDEMDPADLLGGWTTVTPPTSDEANQRTDGAKWRRVEVCTSRRHMTTPNPCPTIRQSKALPPESAMKPHSLSSIVTLHQQILPMPPVTHPLSLASAAREYLPIPRSRNGKDGTTDNQVYQVDELNRVVEQLAFNEDRIVGLVRPKEELVGERASFSDTEEGVIKVWTFDV
ncbi:hypothetical protein QFC22_004347 [Naganishia vaughanmartiniae]|uniref:Uncharacterized protein n=1 Tax=Naganishia vaughanmartiniae TaxID=1424756 RepID=A0ACC2X403_9TREE|nr:hypothetical protein QFC22_004347 [Naganishia vaughanmartiniae]